ncbi:hypothetical protein NS115_03675 [Paenibacillus jamilae]|uniref:Uncharacterized protein n=1 Tax=Paenibacillus jamilae TaxID=114136 RepID=A0ACC4ZZD5_9BACL|nr:hypothetical protein [Paenibacillus jamilae]KTS84441.1 hypothetical protein NS115_03675 [Paenibacillus jamilae]
MSKHFRTVNRLHKKSENAVSSFLTIEEELQASNEALDQVIDELEQEMSRISDLWNQAKLRKQQNAEIAERLSGLIRG